MWESLAKCLEMGLWLWTNEAKQEYSDKLTKLRKRRYEEENKDPAHRSDAVLDHLDFELRELAANFAARARESNLAAKS